MNRSIIYMTISSLMFALLGMLIKSIPSGLENEEIVFLRNLLALLIITPFFILQPDKALHYQTIKLYALKIISGLIAMYCYYYALKELPLVSAVLLNNTAPLFIPLVAMLLIKEKFSLQNSLFLLGGFLGVAIILFEGLVFDINLPLVIGLLAGISLAVSSVSVSAIGDKSNAVSIIFYFMLATTLISSIFAVPNWMHPSYEQLIFITLASLVTIIGGVASAKAFLCDSPNKLAALQFLTVPFSFVFGLIFWGEQVSAQFVMGAAIVIIFSYLSVKNHKVQSTIGVQD